MGKVIVLGLNAVAFMAWTADHLIHNLAQARKKRLESLSKRSSSPH